MPFNLCSYFSFCLILFWSSDFQLLVVYSLWLFPKSSTCFQFFCLSFRGKNNTLYVELTRWTGLLERRVHSAVSMCLLLERNSIYCSTQSVLTSIPTPQKKLDIYLHLIDYKFKYLTGSRSGSIIMGRVSCEILCNFRI